MPPLACRTMLLPSTTLPVEAIVVVGLMAFEIKVLPLPIVIPPLPAEMDSPPKVSKFGRNSVSPVDANGVNLPELMATLLPIPIADVVAEAVIPKVPATLIVWFAPILIPFWAAIVRLPLLIVRVPGVVIRAIAPPLLLKEEFPLAVIPVAVMDSPVEPDKVRPDATAFSVLPLRVNTPPVAESPMPAPAIMVDPAPNEALRAVIDMLPLPGEPIG